jgi:hypothetical protein
MIEIKVYKNGYEIIGHAEEKICYQVSMWHWITSNLILGLDSKSREYTTHNDNKADVNEGLSWVICDIQKGNLEWILEDCIVSAKIWGERYWGSQVSIERVD